MLKITQEVEIKFINVFSATTPNSDSNQYVRYFERSCYIKHYSVTYKSGASYGSTDVFYDDNLYLNLLDYTKKDDAPTIIVETIYDSNGSKTTNIVFPDTYKPRYYKRTAKFTPIGLTIKDCGKEQFKQNPIDSMSGVYGLHDNECINQPSYSLNVYIEDQLKQTKFYYNDIIDIKPVIEAVKRSSVLVGVFNYSPNGITFLKLQR